MQEQVAFVTGGSGFIGSEVIRQLNARGVRVRALLRATSPRRNLEGAAFEEVRGDLGDLEALKKGVAGADYVFHLAGVIAAPKREIYFKHNAEGSANLARACAEANPGLMRFVYVSSLAASGPSASLSARLETDAEAPISAYGESKLAGEREVFSRAEGKFPVTVIRPPAVYGPRDRGLFEFFKIINSGIMPILPARNATCEKHYSLIHVEDLVQGILQAGLAEGQGAKEVFFLAGDGIHTWTQILREIAGALGKKPFRVKVPSFALTGIAGLYTLIGAITGKQFPLTLDKLSELRPDFWICSNEAAKLKIAFRPRYSLADGIANTVEWYKKNGWLA
ncbi:MAG: NAD-dependent epimerase/dehydratase family protein [Deltaproteobacteria bacterium]|nr:NAD-dependent epimerase/dehydratase family protein [Deltaproteobacteria bacterium]